MSYYRTAIILNPTHVDAHYNMASALQELNMPEDAEKYYKRTLALASDHHMAYYNLGLQHLYLIIWSLVSKIFH
jgi:tetratricopeptide (TPR) repeat protein